MGEGGGRVIIYRSLHCHPKNREPVWPSGKAVGW